MEVGDDLPGAVVISKQVKLALDVTTWPLVAVVAIAALFFAETLFFLWFRVKLRQAQQLVPPPKVSLEERNYILNEMFRNTKENSMWDQVKGWYLNQEGEGLHSPHELGRLDLLELLAWAFFYKHIGDLDKVEMEWCEYASRKVVEDFGIDPKQRPERTGVRCIKHTLDQISVIHRPLIFYLSIYALRQLHGLILLARGFRRGRHQGLRYWHRLSQETSSNASDGEGTEPLIFFHGIGIGLVMYTPLLLRLPSHQQVLFEMPWISMNPWAQIPSPHEYSRWVVEALQSHGIQRCVALGHSFGSLPIAWLLRQHPSLLSRTILVDPVAMYLNLPDVCVNFLYKKPKSLSGKAMQFFGAREFGIAKTLMRHFFWTDSVLFPEMLPDGSSVILMENDRILPVKNIYTSSSQHSNIRTVVIPDLDHGHFLVWPSAAKTILDHVAGCAPK